MINFFIDIRHFHILHKHWVEKHPDKLTEEEKKEVKFCWSWYYFTLKGDSIATCNLCNKSHRSKNTSNLRSHLKIMHKEAAHNLIPVRRWIRGHYTKLTESDKATCNHCNDHFDILIRHLFILHKHLVEAHPDKLTEEEKKEVKFFWIWDYFNIKNDANAICKICETTVRYTRAENLKRHLKNIHKILGPSPDSAINNESNLYNDANWDIQVITCNHCNDKYIIEVRHLHILHQHLVEAHPDKLTDEEKKEDKFFWCWDYFTLKGDSITCNLCYKSLKSRYISNLKKHLKIRHKIFGPSPDSTINNESNSYNHANWDISGNRLQRKLIKDVRKINRLM
ncbi:hypothetical protein ALC56_05837 [Trachymyrmex septentrionalis]|uniref:BED-type domain-containing protein n=1 Tax=Trachymyrmex septentrionalis TaxID=34720 RepID=A0A151JXF6_9HYME|nr:hypothetical protein ALC56_05837 [Trachymyrmex septentrionalis]